VGRGKTKDLIQVTSQKKKKQWSGDEELKRSNGIGTFLKILKKRGDIWDQPGSEKYIRC